MKKQRTQCSIILKDGRRCSRGIWTGAPSEGFCIGHSQNAAAMAIKRGSAFSGKLTGRAVKGVPLRDRLNHLKAIESGGPTPAPVIPISKADIPKIISVDSVEDRQALRVSVIKNLIAGAWDPKTADSILKCLEGAAREDPLTISDPASDTLLSLQTELMKKATA